MALFALVPRMRFSQACLAATLYLVCSLLISQSNTLGDRFLGCVGLIGPAWLGAISAGCAVSAALMPSYSKHSFQQSIYLLVMNYSCLDASAASQ